MENVPNNITTGMNVYTTFYCGVFSYSQRELLVLLVSQEQNQISYHVPLSINDLVEHYLECSFVSRSKTIMNYWKLLYENKHGRLVALSAFWIIVTFSTDPQRSQPGFLEIYIHSFVI